MADLIKENLSIPPSSPINLNNKTSALIKNNNYEFNVRTKMYSQATANEMEVQMTKTTNQLKNKQNVNHRQSIEAAVSLPPHIKPSNTSGFIEDKWYIPLRWRTHPAERKTRKNSRHSWHISDYTACSTVATITSITSNDTIPATKTINRQINNV